MFALTAKFNAFVPTMADCIAESQACKLFDDIRIDRGIHCTHQAIGFAVAFAGHQINQMICSSFIGEQMRRSALIFASLFL